MEDHASRHITVNECNRDIYQAGNKSEYKRQYLCNLNGFECSILRIK